MVILNLTLILVVNGGVGRNLKQIIAIAKIHSTVKGRGIDPHGGCM
jgi:hypothetical protein